MYKFCPKCGTAIDGELGLCPNCDKEKIEQIRNAPKFCARCGSKLDLQIGLCPNCSKAPESGFTTELSVTPEPPAAGPVQVNTFTGYNQDIVLETVKAPDEKGKKSKKNKKSKKDKSKSGVKTAVTVLLCILLFVTLFTAVTVYSVRNFTSEENVEDIIDELEYSDIASMVADANGISSGKKAMGMVLDPITEYLEKETGVTVSDDDFEDFIERSDLKEFMAEKINDFFDDIFSNKNNFSLTTEDVYDFIDDSEKDIYKYLHVVLDETHKAQISEYLIDEDASDELSVSEIKDDAPALYYVVSIGLSYVVLAAMILLSIFMIFMAVYGDVFKGICGTGIVFTLVGAIFSIPAVISAAAPGMWQMICGDNLLISFITGKYLAANMSVFITVTAVGILAVVIIKIIQMLVNRKKEG